MAPEFRYSLTRICLRTGQLSLSRRMADIFPEAGRLRALDTVDDREIELSISEPRKVSGLADYFERHRLDVNDEIKIAVREDGRVCLTSLPRRTRRSFGDGDAKELLDSLVDEAPMTEAEIRALHPQIPADYPLGRALAAHPRLNLRGGRWVGEKSRAGQEAAAADAKPGEDLAEGSDPVAGPNQSSRASRERSSRWDAAPIERDRDRARPGRPAAVTPYPRGVLFPGEAALNSQRPAGDLRLVNRAREALNGFGYRVEGLPHGMLLARADLGRRKHAVLVRVLADGERLDWAALLAKRRESTADYLAVFGDHRDLHRLSAPAELARATLWSWDGIDRVRNLAKTVLIGPFDLEPHFAKDGMFENGLELFERSLGRMIAEKGALSAVIARLGSLRAPAVFVLDDLVEGELQREQVVNALEQLSQAPFHLVARVDRGEYCLRHPLPDALAHLAEYALSLLERLPGAGSRRGGATEGRVSAVNTGSQASSGNDIEGSGSSAPGVEVAEEA